MVKNDIKKIKLYLGPMSKNIVDGIIDYNTNVSNSVGMIASRRQIDYYGGYVNNWKTSQFESYVKKQNKDIVICRDHGGINQGSFEDDGMNSFLVDAVYMNIIHIDPFKTLNLLDSAYYTMDVMLRCLELNPNCLFEIGTEQAIQPLTIPGLDYFLNQFKTQAPELIDKIAYVVIQSGTSLQGGVNTGEYDKGKLSMMLDVCKQYGVLSKEHNGDYLTPKQIKEKFKMGLSAINIAPQVAHIETEYIMRNLTHHRFTKWFEMIVDDGSWMKWFPSDFSPYKNTKKVVKLCGHYVFTKPEFNDIFNLQDASEYVKDEMHNFINDRIG